MSDYADTSGKTQVAFGPVAGRTFVSITAGQSRRSNMGGGPGAAFYTAQNNVLNFDHNTGLFWQAKDPLLGCSDAYCNIATRKGDKTLASAKVNAARVILVPIAITSTNVTQWAPGGNLNARIYSVGTSLAAAGLHEDEIIWGQGPAEFAAGGVSTASAYAEKLQGVIDSFRAAGMYAPFIITLESYPPSGDTAKKEAIREGQMRCVNPAKAVFLGQDFDAVTHAYDDSHPDITGMEIVATNDNAITEKFYGAIP